MVGDALEEVGDARASGSACVGCEKIRRLRERVRRGLERVKAGRKEGGRGGIDRGKLDCR